MKVLKIHHGRGTRIRFHILGVEFGSELRSAKYLEPSVCTRLMLFKKKNISIVYIYIYKCITMSVIAVSGY